MSKEIQIFEPLEDRVLILPIKKTESEKTAAGIITDTIKKEIRQGEVVAVGPGRYAGETGNFMPTLLHKGDLVIIGVESGLPISVPRENGVVDECVILREADVLILVSKKSE